MATRLKTEDAESKVTKDKLQQVLRDFELNDDVDQVGFSLLLDSWLFSLSPLLPLPHTCLIKAPCRTSRGV